jgi:hypothetical protein
MVGDGYERNLLRERKWAEETTVLVKHARSVLEATNMLTSHNNTHERPTKYRKKRKTI